MKTSKYHAVKTNGYDSAREAERARQLHLLQKAGAISDLREQVPFELIPEIWLTPDGKKVPLWGDFGLRRSVFLAPGEDVEPDAMNRKGWRRIQRKCQYVADFVYTNGHGETVVENSKGYQTDAYKLKKNSCCMFTALKSRKFDGRR